MAIAKPAPKQPGRRKSVQSRSWRRSYEYAQWFELLFAFVAGPLGVRSGCSGHSQNTSGLHSI